MPRPVGTMGETKLKILAIIYFNETSGSTTYGYDIWKVLKIVFHIYLDSVNLRNIYRHLRDLERLGLVSKGKHHEVEGAPRRRPYSLTDKGRELKRKFTRYADVISRQAITESIAGEAI